MIKIISKKILDIIDSNKFNHKNKIGKFRYNDIKDLVDSINKNTISEIHAEENINAIIIIIIIIIMVIMMMIMKKRMKKRMKKMKMGMQLKIKNTIK